MKIYIAAPFEMRTRAIHVMEELESLGHVVTSRWLKQSDKDNVPETGMMDIEDIDDADALLALNPEEYRHRGTGGRHFEMGFAVATGKRILLVGKQTNLFHYLDVVEHYETLEAIKW